MLRPCSPRTSDSRPLVGWHLSPEPEHQGRSSRDLRLPNKYQTEATAQRLRCLVTIGSALGFRLRTWPACCPRECSPPCPPHTRGRGATSSKQDQKGRMTQGVAWAGRSEVESCTPSGLPSQGGTSETELTAILWRTARCKDARTVSMHHAATSRTSHTRAWARSDKISSTEREPHEASWMTEYRAAPQNPNAV